MKGFKANQLATFPQPQHICLIGRSASRICKETFYEVGIFVGAACVSVKSIITIMKYITLLSFLILCLSCANKQPDKNAAPQKLGLDSTTDTYTVTPEDTTINKAIDKAKNTLADFNKALQSKNPSYSEFAVKKKYLTNNGYAEHMWIAGITIENGDYKGFLNNDPEQNIGVKLGDKVTVKKSEITDWMYLDNDVLKGGYTIRAIRNKLSKEERKKMDADLGFKIED